MEIVSIKSAQNSNALILPRATIISSIIVSLSCELLLNFVGITVGIFLFNTNIINAYNLGFGLSIWLLISGLVSMTISVWVVGNFYLIQSTFKRTYMGLIAWVCVIIILLMAKSAIYTFIGGFASIIGSTILKDAIHSVKENQTQNLIVPFDISNNIKPNKHKNKNSNSSKLSSLTSSSILLFIVCLSDAIASILGNIYSKFATMKDNEIMKKKTSRYK